MESWRRWWKAQCLPILMLVMSQGYAADLTLQLDANRVLRHAVVFVEPKDSSVALVPSSVDIIQKNKQYAPYIQVVSVGDTVRFPNQDDVFHHVYSFSSPKKFEIPLYDGLKKIPEVQFDQPGVVVLGCNIHDWMLAYVLILETPFYGVLNEGETTIKDLPAGDYQLSLWFPSLDNRVHKLGDINMGHESKVYPMNVRLTVSELEQPESNEDPDERNDY